MSLTLNTAQVVVSFALVFRTIQYWVPAVTGMPTESVLASTVQQLPKVEQTRQSPSLNGFARYAAGVIIEAKDKSVGAFHETNGDFNFGDGVISTGGEGTRLPVLGGLTNWLGP